MSMVQIVSYDFSIVESPVSDNGNLVQFFNSQWFDTGGQELGVLIPGTCIVVNTLDGPTAAIGWPVIDAPGGVWPADQYAEVVVSAIDGEVFLCVRVEPILSNTNAYMFYVYLQQNNYNMFFWNGANRSLTSDSCNVQVGDVWRLSITGQHPSIVLTLTQNGSVVATYTDTTHTSSIGFPGAGLYLNEIATDTSISNFAAGAGQCATPTFSPNGGAFTPAEVVTITSATSGATIYYTTDGSTPTEDSSSISNGGTVTLSSAGTLNAIASLTDNIDSTVGSAVFTGPSVSVPNSFTMMRVGS